MARTYLVANYRKGWRGDSNRHRLAALGVSTGKSYRRKSTPLNVQLAIMEAAREKEQRELGQAAEASNLLPFQQQEAQVVSEMQAPQPEALRLIGPEQEVAVPQEAAEAVPEEMPATEGIPGMGAGGSFFEQQMTQRPEEQEPTVKLEAVSPVGTPAAPPVYAARKRYI